MESINDLTDEERAVLAFVRRHFEENNMPGALRILDIVPIEDIRKVIEGYRESTGARGGIDTCPQTPQKTSSDSWQRRH